MAKAGDCEKIDEQSELFVATHTTGASRIGTVHGDVDDTRGVSRRTRRLDLSTLAARLGYSEIGPCAPAKRPGLQHASCAWRVCSLSLHALQRHCVRR